MKKFVAQIKHFVLVLFGFKLSKAAEIYSQSYLKISGDMLLTLNKATATIALQEEELKKWARDSNSLIMQLYQTISQRPLNAFVFTSKGIAVNLSMEKKAQFEVEYELGSETLSFKLVIDYTRVVEVIKIDLLSLSKQEFDDVKFVGVGMAYLKGRRATFIDDIANRALTKTIIRSQHFSMDVNSLSLACAEAFIESAKKYDEYDKAKTKGLRLVDKDSDQNQEESQKETSNS